MKEIDIRKGLGLRTIQSDLQKLTKKAADLVAQLEYDKIVLAFKEYLINNNIKYLPEDEASEVYHYEGWQHYCGIGNPREGKPPPDAVEVTVMYIYDLDTVLTVDGVIVPDYEDGHSGNMFYFYPNDPNIEDLEKFGKSESFHIGDYEELWVMISINQ